MKCNEQQIKSRTLGQGYHMSENRDEIPKKEAQKTQLTQSKKWINTNLSAADMSAKLVEVGGFYNEVENRKILVRCPENKRTYPAMSFLD